jgi:dimethylargininase
MEHEIAATSGDDRSEITAGPGRLIAITREVSPRMADCELSFLPRADIDLALARSQHRRYEERLAELGCSVIRLPAEPDLPDSVFVEDAAVVLDEIAIITRPGAESRRPETESVAAALRPYRELRFLARPATLDGGDVLRVGRTLFVGDSDRTNEAGIAQMRQAAEPLGYVVRAVAVHGCLHLKSAATQVAPDLLLINPAWAPPGAFAGMRFVEVDPAEAQAANALLVRGRVIHPHDFPATRRRLEDLGISVLPVDLSELAKAEGAVTCCSLVFPAAGP